MQSKLHFNAVKSFNKSFHSVYGAASCLYLAYSMYCVCIHLCVWVFVLHTCGHGSSTADVLVQPLLHSLKFLGEVLREPGALLGETAARSVSNLGQR